MIITKPANYSLTFNLKNNQITSTAGPEEEASLNASEIALRFDEYYTKGLCGKGSVGEGIAIFELIPASCLAYFIKSPATITNLLTSFGELLQVWLGRTKRFGDPKVDRKELRKLPEEKRNEVLEKASKAKEKREGIMAWIQILAGISGLFSLGLETTNKNEKEIEELPFLKRASLSTTSLLSAAFMLSGYFEKNFISGIASKLGLTNEHNNMRMNGNSDLRCFFEWISMTLLPWIPKKLKILVDIGIPIVALREGLSEFVKSGHLTSIFSEKKFPIAKGAQSFLKKLLLIKKEKDECSLPIFTKSNFFVNFIRNKLFAPVLKLFKTNPPICSMEGENIVCDLGGLINGTNKSHKDATKQIEDKEPLKVAVS